MLPRSQTRAAIWARQNEAERRVFSGKMMRDPKRKAPEQATELVDASHALLTIGQDCNARLPSRGETEVSGDQMYSPHFADTLRTDPDMVSVDASRQRLSLADQTGGLALALDAAATIGAENSVEKMIAHQISAAHAAAMRLQARALGFLNESERCGRTRLLLSGEAARLMNASARMMAAAQQGTLTLHRLRTAGKQTLVVQHVHVRQGGQAVVAGEISGREPAKQRR